MIETREKGQGRYARQHVAISRQSCWGVEEAGHKVLTYVEYRAVSGVFQNIDPPSPHSQNRRAVRRVGCGTPDIGLASFYGAGLLEWRGIDKLKQSGQWGMACTPRPHKLGRKHLMTKRKRESGDLQSKCALYKYSKYTLTEIL